MYYWHGFPMVAVSKGKGERVIHLVRSAMASERKGTLCGKPARSIVDRAAATGWPDCTACIELTASA